MTSPGHVPIPRPKGVPILGNLLEFDSDVPLNRLHELADIHGQIFRLVVAGNSLVFISSQELANEVCNEERFTKFVVSGLRELRNGVRDGLFTANYPEEENWAIAHRILVPAFGPLMIRSMFDDMYDIGTQLVMKWARQGSNVPIVVTDDFTRLTLDTVGLCSMGIRFNSFYSEDLHPFIKAMGNMLKVAGNRSRRPGLVNSLLSSVPATEDKKFWADIEYMRSFSHELLTARRNHPEDKQDLMNALVLGRDPQTGQGLSDESIVNNMITFLIAGHETTSGALSFLFYFLLKTPRAYKKVQEEVNAVIGQRKVRVEDLPKLVYVDAALKETLRMRSTAPLMALHAHPTKNKEDPVTLGDGKYVIGKNEPVVVVLGKLHMDPKVYGADAEVFKPERMLDGGFERLPNNAWKPFGNGLRACTGRPFAWQEMLLVVALLFQNFNFQLEDPNYELRMTQMLTIKPRDLYMRATLRSGLDATKLAMCLSSSGDVTTERSAAVVDSRANKSVSENSRTGPMHIFFGSNTGTCEAFSRRLANDAVRYGFSAEVKSLDSAMQKVPRDGPVVFITASYEGQPPDNAANFFHWLNGLEGDELEGTKFAVFGCGHHDWQSTFHRVPKAADTLIAQHGGTRLCDLGLADAADADMFSSFDNWAEFDLWPAIASNLGHPMSIESRKSTLQVTISSGVRPSTLGLQLQEGTVLENQLLTAPGVPEKRMIRFKLPLDMTYRCGDYLAVLPINPASVVRHAIRHFDLSWDTTLTLTSNGTASIPLGTPMSAFDLFSTYVELSQPASKRDLNLLADAADGDVSTQAHLRDLASDPTTFAEEIVKKQVSPLDILTRYSSIKIPLEEFLIMLPPMRVRQYSISSSPLPNPSECTITFSVINTAPTAAASQAQAHQGVASNYLSELRPGDRAQIDVRPCHAGFRPPLDLETPMIMICAGSGLAPFRGFIMDRAERISGRRNNPGFKGNSKKPAKAILYVGCRTKGKDDICAVELNAWARLGAVEVRWAYSRPSFPADPSAGPSPALASSPQRLAESLDRQHVQDLMVAQGAEISDLMDHGARVYVCGGIEVANGVRQAFKTIYLKQEQDAIRQAMERGEDVTTEADEDALAEAYLDGLKVKERYATDVFT